MGIFFYTYQDINLYYFDMKIETKVLKPIQEKFYTLWNKKLRRKVSGQ